MYDSIIIGCGPAGMSAAIYLKNANKKVLIIEKKVPGGKILKSKKINNYLGINNVEPSQMAYDMYDQITKMNILVSIENVLDIQDNGHEKKIITNKKTYQAKSIILACGRSEKSLGLKNESKLVGNGISYCAECDGNLFKNKAVAVVGNSKESISEAIYLSNIAKQVFYINYSNEDIKINKENIKIISNLKITSLNEDNKKLESIKLSDNSTIKIDGLFILTGYTPNTDFIEKLNIKTDNGYVIVDDKMKTNIENIYAVGDIIKKDLYQIITAASEGAIAATNIIKNLK